jgi:hypothetical protein
MGDANSLWAPRGQLRARLQVAFASQTVLATDEAELD